MSYKTWLEHGWGLFGDYNKDPYETDRKYQTSYEYRRALSPDNSIPLRAYSRSSFSSMLYNRIAIDVSMTKFQHVKISPDSENQQVIKNSSLQRLFEVEMNLDQTSTDFFHDLTYSLFDEGVVAVAIVEATGDIMETGSFDIQQLRVGKILEWFPEKVKVKLYNQSKGDFSEVILPKNRTAIIENPLNNVLGNQNPTLERLLKKLSLIDAQDLDAVTNKLNMIIQLPNPVRTDTKRAMAEKRVDDIQNQLKKSDLGIAYIGAEEKVTQLNRQINSNLMDEVKYLTDELLSQLGMSRAVFDGTATPAQMQNYNTRIIEPIVIRIREEFQRKFLTKTAYSQGQRIVSYNNPFRLVPTEQLASIGDALLRNSILTPNEFRAVIGYGPNQNPMADELYNRNIADTNQNISIGSAASPEESEEIPEEYYPEEEQIDLQNGEQSNRKDYL